MKQVFFAALFVLHQTAFCQKQTFDIVTYTSPKGWKKKAVEGAMQFTKEDTTTGSYCIITLYKSVPAGADTKKVFDISWETLVKENLSVNVDPEIQEPVKEDGWEARTGYTQFETDGNKGVVMLVTTAGYGVAVNMIVLTNSGEYESAITGFLGGIDLKKPKQTPVPPANDPANDTPPSSNANTSPATGTGGFAYSTTNFDDGWTSTIHDDYVLVTKGNIKVYLSYVEKFNESDYSGTGKQKRFHYWETYVGKYFITGETKFDHGGALSDYSPDYIEGWATDRQANEKRYIALMIRVVAYTGTLSLVIASAPDDQQFRQQFPKADTKFGNDLLPMYNYNKFAIGKQDLAGSVWVSGGKGGSTNWYSATTGNHVGTTAVATSDVFRFINGTNYTSTHNGATGWVGAMNTFQQEYKGTYTVTDWSLTATNRWEKKTDEYNAWYEIVRGGRILHLEGSTTMALFKEK